MSGRSVSVGRASTPRAPPPLTPHAQHLQMLASVKRANEEKLRKLVEEKKQREYEMLKECTFQPTLISRPPRSQSEPRKRPATAPAVRGMKRFMELKKLAASQKSQEVDRMKKMFHLEGCRDMDITSGRGRLSQLTGLASFDPNSPPAVKTKKA